MVRARVRVRDVCLRVPHVKDFFHCQEHPGGDRHTEPDAPIGTSSKELAFAPL